MTRFATILIGSALTSLIASYGFAADPQPETSQPVASSPSSPATAGDAAPAAAASPATEAAAPVAASDKEVKIGYISLNKVASATAEGKAASAKLTQKSVQLRKKLDAKQKQLEKEKISIEARFPTMTPKERAAKGKEFQKKMEAFQKLVRASELEVVELQDKLTGEVYIAIKNAAVEYAKANGYTVLVEEKSVLFVVDSLTPKDLTDEVIELLNKRKK